MIDPKHIENLQFVGLSKNQAKIYLTLVSKIFLTTDEIVKRTEIPRTRVYSDLQYLEKEQWISREDGRPIKYYPKSPQNTYTKALSELRQSFEITENHLKTKWEEREKYETQTISVISGENYLIQETLKNISKAKLKIVLTIRFLYKNEIRGLIKALQIQKIKGKSIKIVIFPELFYEQEETLRTKLIELGVKLGPVPLRALLIDNSHALLSFLSTYEGYTKSETIKISYSNFVELMHRSFNITFEKFEAPD